MIVLIAAVSENDVIGFHGSIPWKIKEDMEHFRKLTLGNIVMMGRKTFESLPSGALDGRINILLSRNKNYSADSAVVFDSIDAAIGFCRKNHPKKNIFVIGGQQIYEQLIPIADVLEITKVFTVCDGDAFFPDIKETDWKLSGEDKHDGYSFLTYIRLR